MIGIFLAALTAAAAPSHACTPVEPAILALEVRSFDQTLGAGWRTIGDTPGCEGAAADLIAAYRRAHAATLVEGPLADIRGLNWHEAQLRAAAGETAAAIALFGRARPDLDPARRVYGDAVIAFLKHDKAALVAARTELLALPKPAWWNAAVLQAPAAHRPVWPEYLPEVDGLITCFDEPYTQAYGYACRSKPGG